MTQTFTLDSLNTLSVDGFITAVGDIFEHAPWVAEGAAGRAVRHGLPLQNGHARARLGQVQRRREAGDAGADHRDVDREIRRKARISLCRRRRAFVGGRKRGEILNG